MTPRQIELYNNLLALTEKGDEFYFQDFSAGDINNHIYRIFNYRMASYTDFCNTDALEMRGIMFLLSEFGTVLQLSSRPMCKFFNCYENPISAVDEIFDNPIECISEVQVKEDGSLISSYIDIFDDQLKLKSKGSIKSDQCLCSMEWIEDHDISNASRIDLYDEISIVTRGGWTVNLEWCSPTNRIILPYDTGHLIVLNIRNNDSGTYMSTSDIIENYPAIASNLAKRVSLPGVQSNNWQYTFDLVKAEVEKEGYIVKFNNDLWIKMKTSWYCELHNCKDSITNQKQLFECVVDEVSDDLKQLFSSDYMALQLIQDMEEYVGPIYNSIVSEVEGFFKDNNHLGRKEYAVKCETELGLSLNKFGLAMALYTGKSVNFKESLKKQWKYLNSDVVDK